ncbi:MAG: RelA/SpoT family protein [Bacteroidales bacterium]|nr:RelA/SpoT family protein [Bacteroidales bacterium]
MYVSDPEKERKEILKRYRNLLTVWNSKTEDKKIVRKAFNFAVDAHKDMRRKTGEPYIYHPLEVAHIVAGEIGLSTTSIICAFLHDVVEDTDFTLADIQSLFGEKVVKIIDGLTKIEGIFDYSTSSVQAENFRKMLLTLSDDVRVILIKLADRLHNMRTLDAMPLDKQLKIASETIYLYAPLAHRLGLYAIKTELEDLALKYTEPDIYKNISLKLKESEQERKKFITKFIFPLKKALGKQGIKYEIIAREKSIYSIWEKMRKKEIPFEEVYDLFAIRIIIDSPLENEKSDCWKIYSIVTDFYRPNLDRLRDWISIPKANEYEALHTTVMGHTGKWVEVQIRTKRMDEIAEKGFAAHWKYKNSSNIETNIDRWLNRIKDMLQSSDSNAINFIDDFKGFLFSDEIFIFTPKGELRNLPVNSTALDFAYAIHSEIGNNCIGAKVNYKLAPLNYKLKSGDQVEIITSKKQKPKDEWFNYVVTTRAKTKIKLALKEEKKNFYKVGKKKLEKYFNQLNLEFVKSNIAKFKESNNYPSLIDLYFDIANNKIGLKELKFFYQEDEKGSWLSNIIKRPFTKSKSSEHKTLSESIIEQLKNKPETLLLKDNIYKISYDISDCCNPIPGDDVIGIINPNEPIEIHRTNCPNAIQLMSRFGNRIVKAKWTDKESIGFLTGIKISGIDKQGFIYNIVKIITDEFNFNIRSFHLESTGGMVEVVIMLYVYSTQNLNNLISNLKKNKDIKKIDRINRISE